MKVSRRLTVWLFVMAFTVATVVACDFASSWLGWGGEPSPYFVVAPYLQPGDQPAGGALELLWQTEDQPALWSVEVQDAANARWREVAPPTMKRLELVNMPRLHSYRASLVADGLSDTTRLSRYRVLRNGLPVFHASLAPAPDAQATHRVVVMGDCANSSADQRAIAYQVYQSHPEYVVLAGDIVYSRGRISEYLDRFFPVYNANRASPATGAPLLRSIPFFAAPGNHDLVTADLDVYPDALGYFHFWAQPLNGPLEASGTAGVPRLRGDENRVRAFLEAVGPAYPRMASFSFTRGPIHWTILDSNSYVDWTSQARLEWLSEELQSPAAQQAAWRFVVFHHPPFQSSFAHAEDQWMRRLAPLFEKAAVSVVFAGHVHNYQRSMPLKFRPDSERSPEHGLVAGEWTLDQDFDGVKNRHARGVIYVVTGGGGAGLYNPEQQDQAETWQPFTARFVSREHSFTLVDADHESLIVRQLNDQGLEFDRFQIDPPARSPDQLSEPAP